MGAAVTASAIGHKGCPLAGATARRDDALAAIPFVSIRRKPTLKDGKEYGNRQQCATSILTYNNNWRKRQPLIRPANRKVEWEEAAFQFG